MQFKHPLFEDSLHAENLVASCKAHNTSHNSVLKALKARTVSVLGLLINVMPVMAWHAVYVRYFTPTPLLSPAWVSSGVWGCYGTHANQSMVQLPDCQLINSTD